MAQTLGTSYAWDSFTLLTGVYVGVPIGITLFRNPNIKYSFTYGGIIGGFVGVGILKLSLWSAILPLQLSAMGFFVVGIPFATVLYYTWNDIGDINDYNATFYGFMFFSCFGAACLGFVSGLIANIINKRV